jgi:hypothetical protein
MMRHLVGEATPELEHLREDASLRGPIVSRTDSAFSNRAGTLRSHLV